MQHMHRNLQEKKGPEVWSSDEALSVFFHSKNLTPTPVTLEIKIKEVLNPFLSAFHGLWRMESAGLD